MAVDFGGDGEEAFGQFEVGLFETEEQYAFAGLAGHGFCDVTDEGCFAHGGASSEDDEFCGLEPGGLFIEVSEAGGDSGDVSGFAKSFIDAIEGIHEDIADGDAGGAALFLDNTEDSPFGTLQQRFHVVGGIVAVGEDFGAGVDQTALASTCRERYRRSSERVRRVERFQGFLRGMRGHRRLRVHCDGSVLRRV